MAAVTALLLAGCGSADPPQSPVARAPAGGPEVLDSVRVTPDLADGRVTGVRVRSATPLLDVAAEDPSGVRTRYVSWQRCVRRCELGGDYDVEARRLLAQALPARYSVPAGNVTLVLAVRVDVLPAGCAVVPALVVRDAAGATHRLTGPAGAPVVTVC